MNIRPSLVTALALCAVPSSAQVAVVHITSCGPITFPGACTIPATGAGNLLVVGWQVGSGANTSMTISSIKDNAGNTFAEAGNARSFDTAIGTVVDIWYAGNTLPGATSLTITTSVSISNGGAVIWELSGADLTAPFDASSVLNSQATTSTPSGPALTLAVPNEIVIGLAAVSGNVTSMSQGSPFTNDSGLKSNGWAHAVFSAPGTYAPQWLTSPSGTYAASTASFKSSSSSGQNPCDLNDDGLVNTLDEQLAVNMSVGLVPCTATLEGAGVCDAVVIQRVVDAAMGASCMLGNSHSVSLTWTSSTTPNISGYNVYRGTTSGGPYTKMNTNIVPATSFSDGVVTAGQTYYYVATTVDQSDNESTYSNEARAVVPSP